MINGSFSCTAKCLMYPTRGRLCGLLVYNLGQESELSGHDQEAVLGQKSVIYIVMRYKINKMVI